MLRLCSLIGLTVVLSAAPCAAQTQAQADTAKDAADDAWEGAWSWEDTAIGMKDEAGDLKAEANAIRADCLAAGATTAQLLAGDLIMIDGNTEINGGDLDDNSADSPWTNGNVKLLTGDFHYDEENWGAAISHYDDSVPPFQDAASHWDDATTHYSDGYSYYDDARMEYETVLEGLMEEE